jgi:hypothetical protein
MLLLCYGLCSTRQVHRKCNSLGQAQRIDRLSNYYKLMHHKIRNLRVENYKLNFRSVWFGEKFNLRIHPVRVEYS